MGRQSIGPYIDVYEYPDGRIELMAGATSLPYTTYNRLPEIRQGAIVENKRFKHALRIAQVFEFIEYWPAVCTLWTEGGGFGKIHHEVTPSYDILPMDVLGFVVNLFASIYGNYGGDLEIFAPGCLALRH